MASKNLNRTGMAKFVAVVGEIFLTIGVIILLYVAWYFWFSNVQADVKQDSMVKEFVQENTPQQDPIPPAEQQKTDPPVLTAPAHGETFGVIYIPRFGENYYRPLVEGTTQDVLDTLGLGHYKSTVMPGAKGNFAVAGHRQTHGSVLDKIHTLQPGDKIYVQTKDGFYTYVYRNSEIVLPTNGAVLSAFPGKNSKTSDQSILTMTSCNPKFGSEERIIAYSMLDSWQPANAGPPAEIAATVASLQNS